VQCLLGSSATCILYIKIDVYISCCLAANRAPVFSGPDNITVAIGDVIRVYVTANDPDGDPVRLSLSQPVNGASVTSGKRILCDYSVRYFHRQIGLK